VLVGVAMCCQEENEMVLGAFVRGGGEDEHTDTGNVFWIVSNGPTVRHVEPKTWWGRLKVQQ
jgi:hypothetical protein